MTTRARKQEVQYQKHIKTRKPKTGCSFCDINKGSDELIRETPNFRVIVNLFPYALWDEFEVADHLMLIPKVHVDSMSSLSDSVALEYMRLISEYEAKGYSIYARSPGSGSKSIAHQHTHLIKNIGRRKKMIMFMRKPHFLLAK